MYVPALPGCKIILFATKHFPLPHRRCGKTVYKVTIFVQKKQEIVGLETNCFYLLLYSLLSNTEHVRKSLTTYLFITFVIISKSNINCNPITKKWESAQRN